MPTRRHELTRQAARLFAERGYHGTSMGDIAEALGVQKGSLYSLTGSKQQLLYDTMRAGADAFHDALDAVPEERRRRSACARPFAATSASSPSRSTSPPSSRASGATSRALSARRSSTSGAATRSASAPSSAKASRAGELRSDLDAGAAALLVLSAANWAYTWLTPGRDTDELADRFTAILVDGIRGYATPR